MASKVKAKKKGTPKQSQRRFEREIDQALTELDENVDKLYAYAEPIYKAQDSNTQDAIDRAVEAMRKMAPVPTAKVPVKGYDTPAVVRVEKGIQDKAFLYIAVKMFVYAARMDVQIGKFKLLPKSCAECGRKVK